MITYVAIPYQVYALTGSTVVVGLLGLAELAPLLVTALIGGALADAHDRRRLVLAPTRPCWSSRASCSRTRCSASRTCGSCSSSRPGCRRRAGSSGPRWTPSCPAWSRATSCPPPRRSSRSGVNVAQIAGPALAGVLIASAGLAATYAVDVASFVVSLVALARMRAVPPPPDAAPPSLARIAEGWRYARSRQELMGTYRVDVNAMLFGFPVALYPAVADRLGGPEVLGLLHAAGPAGAVVLT